MALCVWLWVAPAAAQQLALKRYGKAEGLSNLNVICLVQDRAGPLWACTENGMFMYDGDEFTRYGEEQGLDNTLVLAAALDRQGRLWARTTSDLYLGVGGRFTPVRPGGRPLRLPETAPLLPLDDGTVATIVDGHAAVLAPTVAAGGGWAVGRLHPAGDAAAVDNVVGLYRDRLGHDWMGCGRAICRVDRNGPRRWSVAEGVPSDTWLAFLLDSAGRLWARGPHHLVRLDPDADRFHEEHLDGLAVTSNEGSLPLAEAPDGSLMLRTNIGVARLAGQRWSTYTPNNGLDTATINALLFDAGGNLWLAPSGHGLIRALGFREVESWTTKQGLDNDTVWGLARLPGLGMIVGTRDGCVALPDGATQARRCPFEGLPRGELAQIVQAADGRRWALLRRGELYAASAGSARFQLLATLPKTTSALLDRRGRLWLPSRNGLYCFDTLADRQAPPSPIGDGGAYLDAAEDGNGAVWVAGSDGLRRERDGRWQRFPLGDQREDAGFASVAPDQDGWLWAASRSRGLLHAHVQGDHFDRWEWVDHAAVASTGLMFVRLDQRGRVWAGTEYGAVVYDGHTWRRFTEGDGLIWDDVDAGSFSADADGSVWIGTSGGLSHILRPDSLVSPSPSTLQVVDGRFGGEHRRPGTASWPWRSDSALDLRLASYQFDRSSHTVYRYRIEGIDHDWFESTSPRVHYPALPPGAYRLEALVVDLDHGTQSPTIDYRFELRPPWWRTTWFAVAVVLSLSGLLAAGGQWLARRLRARHAAMQRELAERGRLLERATRDALTGLWNRATVIDLLRSAIDAAGDAAHPLGVALIDVDHFKAVNDSHGHACGDAVLRQIAERLGVTMRSGDILGRYGGEELLMVLPALPKERPAMAVERLRACIADALFECDGRVLPVTASFGVAWLDAAVDTADTLVQRADAAMYTAKAEGRNRVAYG